MQKHPNKIKRCQFFKPKRKPKDIVKSVEKSSDKNTIKSASTADKKGNAERS